MISPIVTNAALITVASIISAFVSYSLVSIWKNSKLPIWKVLGWSVLIVWIALIIALLTLYSLRNILF